MSQLIEVALNRSAYAWELFVSEKEIYIEKYWRICQNLMIRGNIDEQGGVILSPDLDERFLFV